MANKSSTTKTRLGSILVTVRDTDEGGPVSNASILVFRTDLDDYDNFDPDQWNPEQAQRAAEGVTDATGSCTIKNLQPDNYVVFFNHMPETDAQCVEVECGCAAVACFTLGLEPQAAITARGPDCQPSECGIRTYDDVTVTVGHTNDANNPLEVVADPPLTRVGNTLNEFHAVLKRAGRYEFRYALKLPRRLDIGEPGLQVRAGVLRPAHHVPGAAPVPAAIPGAIPAAIPATAALTATAAAAAAAIGDMAVLLGAAGVDVNDRVPAPISGNVGVSLTRTETEPTEDLPLWTLIRNSTEAMSFTNYLHFIDELFCSTTAPGSSSAGSRFNTLSTRRNLPFVDADSYRVLKAATEAFVMVNCGVVNAPMAFDPVADLAYLDRRDIPPVIDMAAGFQDYLENLNGTLALPYLAIIRRKLPDVTITIPNGNGVSSAQDADLCFGIIQRKLANPCMLELIWSYWQEEGMLVQTMNAIAQRFQNVRAPGTTDPLANLEIDPLRPLNNLIWGYTQDEQHRLTVNRRNYEYDHEYGVRLDGKAVASFRPADSRSKFLEAFHYLLRLCTSFFRQDDDTTVKADAFPILNALKEVHLILSQGAHNQFGDLPSTARVEMLMQQWLLSRPEFREFLPTRIMVAYPEPWMDRVDAMKKLQGWSDTSVMHFRSLAVFGEQLLLSIRYGNWSDIYEPTPAFNWARFWRPQVQGYIHSYRAATGVDLTIDTRDPVAEGTLPSVLLRQRLEQQARLS